MSKKSLEDFVVEQAFKNDPEDGTWQVPCDYTNVGNRLWFAERSFNREVRLLDEMIENGYANPYHDGELRLGNGIFALDEDSGDWVAFGLRWVPNGGKLSAKWVTVGSKPEYSNLNNVIEFFDDFGQDAAPALALRDLVAQDALGSSEEFDMETYSDCMMFLVSEGVLTKPEDIRRYIGKSVRRDFMEEWPSIKESMESYDEDEDAA